MKPDQVIKEVPSFIKWIQEYFYQLRIKEKDSKSLLRPLLRANYELALLHIGIGGNSIFALDFSTFRILLPRN